MGSRSDDSGALLDHGGIVACRAIRFTIACETQFAEDLLSGGVSGLAIGEVRAYLEYCADQRLATLGFAQQYGAKNPFGFLALQDVQEVTNVFERRVSAYRVGIEGEVTFDASF